MSRWLNLALSAGVACGCLVPESTTLAQAVSRERDVRVTGPRGRTIERRVEVDRGPGYVDRQVQIQRPGGSLTRDTRVVGGPPGPRFGPGPGFGPRPPVFMPHRPSPAWGFGTGMGLGLGMGMGLGMATAPVIVAPLWQQPVMPPVIVTAPPAVVVRQPSVVVAPAAVDPLDPVALAAQRLQSLHGGSRREAAQTLGRLGDPRGIPPLVDALKNDWSKEVRITAAHALGEIGGSEAEDVLERCIVYEKKQDVRDAAAAALHMVREKNAAARASIPTETVIKSRVEPSRPTSPRPAYRPMTTSPAAAAAATTVPPPPAPGVSSPLQWEPAPHADEPALDGPAADPEDQPAGQDRIPPPPPSPV